MKFVDEAKITVEAGNGGHGCVGFRREKYVPLGGPDGGDGGDGGSVYLVVASNMNTLVDFRYHSVYQAEAGGKGMGRNRTGKSGEDCYIRVPGGTLVFDLETGEQIGDLVKEGGSILVAQGGFHGLGNTRFKSSTNRSPRKATNGTPGERRDLRLELKLIADVGLLGLPNAGKSSLVRSVSSATPKIADYPFTTLQPHLGLVRVDSLRSFVMADVPGIIAGAAKGVGLGMKFLRHLSRTRLLLHIVDVNSGHAAEAPATAVKQVISELQAWNAELVGKPRWLVLNKIDLLPVEHMERRCRELVEELRWEGPVFKISALKGDGKKELIFAIMSFLKSQSGQDEEQS